MTMRCYSPYFQTIYDEQSPVGQLGRGTHYSILSAVQWKSSLYKNLSSPNIHTFAVLWDEDHDERIMNVLEVAYMSNLMPAVKIVGERKGSLSVVFDSSLKTLSKSLIDPMLKEWDRICQAGYADDVWNFEYGFDDNPALSGIINDKPEKVNLYVANIANLWPLGQREYRPVNLLERHKPVVPPIFQNSSSSLFNKS
ncbi:hypothetical protein ACP6EW_00980 [Hafnia paralvei]|uniref:hypothetical protein n=1 Tax=Hafnia paralvei TaxID=546367 RepID=UPI003CE96F5B